MLTPTINPVVAIGKKIPTPSLGSASVTGATNLDSSIMSA